MQTAIEDSYFQTYVIGMDRLQLSTITDQKPVAPLINNEDLDTVLVRCQRRLMRFNGKVMYTPGKTLQTRDVACSVNAVTHLHIYKYHSEIKHLCVLTML